MSNEETRPGRYVLVTPTKDEEAYIGETIASVLSQSCLPAEWVIVSDGSTDATDSIVKEAMQEAPWIRLIQLPERQTRCFGAVSRATRLALESLESSDYDFIGLLDSDVRLPCDYYERVISEFEADPGLGLAGGVAVDVGSRLGASPRNQSDIPGAVQFFSKGCFESLTEIYVIPEGGWDTLTCAEARMNGYVTKLLPDLVVDHLKPRNIGEGGAIRRQWNYGVREYALGYHPIFEGMKCISRCRESPVILSSFIRFIGYLSGVFTKRRRVMPQALVQFVRSEQKKRMVPGILREQTGS